MRASTPASSLASLTAAFFKSPSFSSQLPAHTFHPYDKFLFNLSFIKRILPPCLIIVPTFNFMGFFSVFFIIIGFLIITFLYFTQRQPKGQTFLLCLLRRGFL